MCAIGRVVQSPKGAVTIDYIIVQIATAPHKCSNTNQQKNDRQVIEETSRVLPVYECDNVCPFRMINA